MIDQCVLDDGGADDIGIERKSFRNDLQFYQKFGCNTNRINNNDCSSQK
jgi:hypothetical protein